MARPKGKNLKKRKRKKGKSGYGKKVFGQEWQNKLIAFPGGRGPGLRTQKKITSAEKRRKKNGPPEKKKKKKKGERTMRRKKKKKGCPFGLQRKG